jgi:hypothetical protein
MIARDAATATSGIRLCEVGARTERGDQAAKVGQAVSDRQLAEALVAEVAR